MTLLPLIQQRTSIRKFIPEPLSPEKLDNILEAMHRAPSAGNRQAWLFYVATSTQAKRRLAEITGFEWIYNAGAIIAVCGTDCGVMTNGHRSDTVDLSIAMSFGMLEAADLQLGTCWLAHYEEPAVRTVFGLPDTCSIAALMPVGRPGEAPAPRPRKPLSDIVRMV